MMNKKEMIITGIAVLAVGVSIYAFRKYIFVKKDDSAENESESAVDEMMKVANESQSTNTGLPKSGRTKTRVPIYSKPDNKTIPKGLVEQNQLVNILDQTVWFYKVDVPMKGGSINGFIEKTLIGNFS